MEKIPSVGSWSVNHAGSYIDCVRVSDVTLDKLDITAEKKTIEVAIGNKEDADFPRGLNLFGRKFGNCPQDIVLNMNYIPE